MSTDSRRVCPVVHAVTGGGITRARLRAWGTVTMLAVMVGRGGHAATPVVSSSALPSVQTVSDSDKSISTGVERMVPVAPPLVLAVSADGKEVIDAKAKLAWRRCVEGMVWFGNTCTGRAKTFTMTEAQALVTAEGKATGQRWRLPHIPELKRLLDKSHVGKGAMVDTVLLPATPMGWHWSASVSVGAGGAVNQYNYGNIMSGVTPGNANQLKALEGWGLNFATGEASGGISKRDALYVRLVRPHF